MMPTTAASPTGSISFRPLERADYPCLQKWLAAPHVAIWWNEPFDLPSLEAKYGPRIDGSEPVRVYLIQLDRVPIGWIQWYRWCDFPEHAGRLSADPRSAGLDLAIGEVEKTGLGLGAAIIREFGTKYIFVDGSVNAIIADPARANTRSVCAFEKAGFRVLKEVQLPDEEFVRAVVCWKPMHPETILYNQALAASDTEICNLLASEIDRELTEAENKIWHRHPVWFLDGNPVAGYSKLKGCIRLLFWSGRSFEEPGLQNEGSFQAAEARYTDVSQVDVANLRRWLKKSREIQWDYKNIVRRKGRLERLK